MSVIRKLLIQGIRSFDPQNQDIIEFYTPLTIIVGQNGCGKTTIIECLKYITTGELPPNSKGGAFIHDPKLVGENEVKAQVKLRFYNISQRSMTCVRSMLLTQKKATVTQKTLEGALSFDGTATQDKVSISSRCADLDAMLPEQLGVSKAVLENVIFCHQEESNWPLSEPATLKKRFDEIFAATRYTKALDSIKTIRKNQAVEIRVSRGELKHLEEKKTKSERVRTEYEKSTVSIHKYRERIEDIQQQEALVASQIEALAGQLQEFMSLQTTLEGLQMNLDQKIASYQELEANTNVLDVSSEELERVRADITKQIESQESDIQNKRDERDSLQKKIEQLQSKTNETLSEIGRLRAAQDSLDTKIAGRAGTVSELCVTFSISVESGTDQEQQANECTRALESLLTTAKDERKSMRQQVEDKERTLQSDVDAKQAEIYSFNNAAEVSDKQTTANVQQIHNLKRKRESMQVDDAKRTLLEDELAKEVKQLELAREKDNGDVYQESAKKKRMELAGVIDEIEQLNAEIKHNNRQADTRAKLALKKKDLEDKNRQWDSLVSTAGLSDYSNNGADFASERERTAAISDAIAKKKQAIHDNSSKAKGAHDALANSKLRLKLAQQSFDEQAKDIAEKDERIRKVCDVAQFDATLADTQSEMHELMEEAGQWKSVSSMYTAYIKKIENDHACPVCQRGWSNKDDEGKIVNKLKIDYTSAPTELIKVEGEIRDCQRRLDTLTNLKSAVRDVNEWNKSGKTDLEAQVRELTSKEGQVSADADDIDCESVVLSTELEDMVEHLAKSKELMELEESRQELQRQVEGYERELQATGSTKTIDELQAQVGNCQAQESTIRRELDQLSKDHILQQKEIGFRQDSIRKIQGQMDQFTRQANESEGILQRIAELELANTANETEAKEARVQAEKLGPQLVQAQKRLSETRSDARTNESRVDQHVRDLMQGRDRLQLMADEIEQTRARLRCEPGSEYVDRLEMATAERDKLHEQTSLSSQQLAAAVTVLQESDRIGAKLAAQQRETVDNIRLRANHSEQERIRGELKAAQESQARLESQLSQIYEDENDDGEVEEDTDGNLIGVIPRKRRHGPGGSLAQGAAKRRGGGGARLQQRREILNAKLSELTGSRAGLQGEVKQLEDQARRLTHELATDYKDVDMLYVRQLVQCKTEELANTDLETYGRALDSAIMRYHSLKMQDINKIIRELWINTYQGNDIDTIEIRSEMDGARNIRSHNYRVVMVKGGHAIDMRGRCSAGQKVLACLVIRLALAETFSVNCGILALDEPTTNLDQENIDSLARSLARIIKSRRELRNFQLIVITHDEIFMQLLGKSEYADYYWRVYKDENQCSVFARRPIANN
ncbi:DNA repair protein rad50 [Coemansia sp. RSA 1878]|nr:DNA repair protein rad50 [Coemansia sp. RSA 1878]